MARSHPEPDWDLKMERRQFSNDGRHRLMVARTASASCDRIVASPSCGQLIVTGMKDQGIEMNHVRRADALT